MMTETLLPMESWINPIPDVTAETRGNIPKEVSDPIPNDVVFGPVLDDVCRPIPV